MPRDEHPAPLAIYVEHLNDRFRQHPACSVLAHAIGDERLGPIALASSFGVDSVVLIHMVAQLDRHLPVLFLDTRMLFRETLTFQREVAADLGLTDLRVVRPDTVQLLHRDTDCLLHRSDQNACCQLRKVEPLEQALEGFGAWITGRKRFQGGHRVALEHFELQDGRVKVNPLAHWSAGALRTYIDENNLPRHPLQAKGFSSVGCAPCTSPSQVGEPSRAGRWRDSEKAECGIHFTAGSAVRTEVKA
jgi:phosphoadenosine phosphosulfate reductase